MRRNPGATVGMKMGSDTCEGMGQPLAPADKKCGISVLQPRGTEFCQFPEQVQKWILPHAFRYRPSLANPKVSVL